MSDIPKTLYLLSLCVVVFPFGEVEAAKKTVGQCDLEHIAAVERCQAERDQCQKIGDACESKYSICLNNRRADHRDCVADADKPIKQQRPTLQGAKPKASIQQSQ